MNGDRITYIDAMRGLAMIMVVVSHCCDGCFFYQPIYNTLINHALQIPLFFFISGFFVSRLTQRNILTTLSDKFRHLVLPALIMLGLFCWIFGQDYIDALLMSMKNGYWFTIVLFGYISIYVIVDKITKKFRLSAKGTLISHFVIALTISYASLFTDRYYVSYPILSLLSIKEYFSYIYFILGAVMFKYRMRIFNTLNHNVIMGGVLY